MYCFRVVGLKKLDKSFLPDTGLEAAIELLREVPSKRKILPEDFPESGFGELVTLELLAPYVLGGAAKLDDQNILRIWIPLHLGSLGPQAYGMRA